jgi:hypothetical protein
MEVWTVVNDGRHNAFTDLLYWRDRFWLAYVSSPSHFASKRSRVVILKSTDAKTWEGTAELSGNGEDIRDPKLAVINDRLVLYALLNKRFDPEPYRTITTCGNDGVNWSSFADVTPEGWLLGRPVTQDQDTWFAPAHRIDHGMAVLLRSQDGVNWDIHGTIKSGDRADETAVLFLPDGHMLAASRVEAGGGIFGHPDAGTEISSARAPYQSWISLGRSKVTRLDGPALVHHNGHVYAIGRLQPKVAGPFQWQGSALGRKRCAIFCVEENIGELIHLVDLPSAGDTSYPGAVMVENKLFISYYTNDIRRDPRWITGMLLPTSIQMAMIETKELEEEI